jgi:gamma-glutamyl phosphate reductase
LLAADGIRAIAKQEEPVGRLLSRMEVAEGLVLDKVRRQPGSSAGPALEPQTIH